MNSKIRITDISPVTEQQHDVLIIGTGFGGLGIAIRLKKAGLKSFIILEKADAVGGTWRDNTYPGAACDIQSHLYSFSFEPKSDWSRKFPQQEEILGYLEGCARKHQIFPHIHFHKEVISADFDESSGLWTVLTADKSVFLARVVVTACGQLSRPAIPTLKGLDSFTGKTFHSARWDHDYDLSGKSVAVIGTGASAIQFLPAIVSKVRSLTLFQRSGAWVIPKADRSFSMLERRVFNTVPAIRRAYRGLVYLKNEAHYLGLSSANWALEGYAWRSRLNAQLQVKEAVKRKAVIPDYKIGCKRVLLSDDWFSAINQECVTVETCDIERVEHNAIVTRDGKHYPVDAIIYGTGFRATDFLAPITIRGINGVELNNAWLGGAEAYKGICVAGFPNFFMLYGPNTNLGHNSIVYMLESQIRYIIQCVKLLAKGDIKSMNIKAERQKDYVLKIQERLKHSVWESGCTSWYKTASGRNTNNWPGFTFMYRISTYRLDVRDFDICQAGEYKSTSLKVALPSTD